MYSTYHFFHREDGCTELKHNFHLFSALTLQVEVLEIHQHICASRLVMTTSGSRQLLVPLHSHTTSANTHQQSVNTRTDSCSHTTYKPIKETGKVFTAKFKDTAQKNIHPWLRCPDLESTTSPLWCVIWFISKAQDYRSVHLTFLMFRCTGLLLKQH